jgi:DNA-binding NarL/FixJ family response regulator
VSIQVLIVDDQALVRAGFKMILESEPEIEIVGEAEDGLQAVEAARELRPDVVLMDIRMPGLDGITATARLRRRQHPPEVIVLTTFDADELVLRALRVGASGFLLKDTPPAQIVDAIRRVAAGDPILSSRITRRLIDMVAADDGSRERARRALATLSGRERDVVLGIAQGRSNAELAAALHISVATVKAHVSNILSKLGLDNRTQIALLAHDAGAA